MHSALTEMAATGVFLFTQNSHSSKLRFVESSGFGEIGRAVGYRHTFGCFSPDTCLERKRLPGQPAGISLPSPDGADAPYRLELTDGTVREGTTSAAGETDLLEDERFKIAAVRFDDKIR
ncbi:MAG: hypothetical protein QM739_15070 [Propionivibrio sp.]